MIRSNALLLMLTLAAAGCRSHEELDRRIPLPEKAGSGSSPFPTTPQVDISTPPEQHTAVERDPELEAALNFREVAGTRDGTYQIWINVSRAGTPVRKAVVGAVDGRGGLIASDTTDAHGVAYLGLPNGTCRIVARRGHWIADESVSIHGTQNLFVRLRHAGKLPF